MHYDVLFAGGGLSNGLAAYRYSLRHPKARIAIVEAGPSLGGTHTWCFHDSDLSIKDRHWMAAFVSRSWPGYHVHFPKYSRRLESAYFAIESQRFHDVIADRLKGNILLNTEVAEVGKDFIRFKDRRKLLGRMVVDGRGWPAASDRQLGFQKFLGQRIEMHEPHGLREPVVMDATCAQEDGYRFFYLLPWSATELLIEDTHYSEIPSIDAPLYRLEIAKYCEKKKWLPKKIHYEETGSLPLPLSRGKLVQSAAVVAGLRAELFHATTGYSLPTAVTFANLLSEGVNTATWSEQFVKEQRFFRLLNRMLFQAAKPEQRFKVLAHFYRLPEPLIQRFYRGSLSKKDKWRLLWGRPPVSVWRALACLKEEVA